MRPTATIAVLLAFAADPGGAQFDENAWRQRMESTLRPLIEEVTGPVAEPCGIAWLERPPDPNDFFPSRAKEIAGALACVQKAASERRATWALWQYQGIDSTVMSGLAVAPDGGYRLLGYDSYPPQRFSAISCPLPRLDPSAPSGIACGAAMIGREASAEPRSR